MHGHVPQNIVRERADPLLESGERPRFLGVRTPVRRGEREKSDRSRPGWLGIWGCVSLRVKRPRVQAAMRTAPLQLRQHRLPKLPRGDLWQQPGLAEAKDAFPQARQPLPGNSPGNGAPQPPNPLPGKDAVFAIHEWEIVELRISITGMAPRTIASRVRCAQFRPQPGGLRQKSVLTERRRIGQRIEPARSGGGVRIRSRAPRVPPPVGRDKSSWRVTLWPWLSAVTADSSRPFFPAADDCRGT